MKTRETRKLRSVAGSNYNISITSNGMCMLICSNGLRGVYIMFLQVRQTGIHSIQESSDVEIRSKIAEIIEVLAGSPEWGLVAWLVHCIDW